jgi:F0F1-type ATP synthase delta subunit
MPLSRKLATLLIDGKATLADVVALLTKYKMLSLLPSIKHALTQMASAKSVEETILIQSPFPLTESSVSHIRTIIGDKDAQHRVVINKNVLAGFKAKFKGMVYDGSAERIIKQFINQ